MDHPMVPLALLAPRGSALAYSTLTRCISCVPRLWPTVVLHATNQFPHRSHSWPRGAALSRTPPDPWDRAFLDLLDHPQGPLVGPLDLQGRPLDLQVAHQLALLQDHQQQPSLAPLQDHQCPQDHQDLLAPLACSIPDTQVSDVHCAASMLSCVSL